MEPALDSKLTNTFPNLYKDRFEDMHSTCMCWGFSCGEGWFDLLWRLSEKLEPMILQYIKDNPGQPAPCASQVKEKFGTLRFYMDYSTDEMDKLISEAESESERTCEDCGKPGKLREGGWLSVRCDECENKKAY